MTWRIDGPQGNEAAKVKWDILPYTRGKVLDLGCGPWKTYPHFTGVDNCKDVELFGVPEYTPDLKVDSCQRLDLIEDESCDAVFSSHLLEHIEDPGAALAEWWRVIKPGGHLVLYLPHANLYPRVGQEGANPDHKHDFLPKDIYDLVRFRCGTRDFGRYGFDLVLNETRDWDDEYSFLQVYRKDLDCRVPEYYDLMPQRRISDPPRACVVRYGGFGDQLQAANLLPELKRQGYHVTFMTTPSGKDILEHDPHIDAWMIQEKDEVPNHELVAYWKSWARRFDKFVNLSESVEAHLLAMPGRANHAWPDSVRRKYLDVNYLEWTADLAELPYKSESTFYATDEEMNAVKGLLHHHGGRSTFHVMWALAGSSMHKFTPHQDIIIQGILDNCPNAHVYLVGDQACKVLESGWEEHKRVTCLSGELNIRGTLALAQIVDCVIGPETGVLNSVAFAPEVLKVVFLSHSSVENLTKHWRNTISLTPRDTPCYPCHRLHYTREFCPEDAETGAAMCQKNIPPAAAFEAAYRYWKKMKPAGEAA